MSADELTHAVWTVDADEFPVDAPIEERARFLLRYAVLAPSSHNSQPWPFAVDGATVDVDAEASRRLAVADGDRRELHLSLGCALENLLVAAARFDLAAAVDYGESDADGDGDEGGRPVASVTLDPDGESDPSAAALFEAVTARRTDHRAFEDRPLPEATRERLRDHVGGDIDLVLVDDARKAEIARLQATADERQMADDAYRRELGRWIGTGALGASWLAARIGQAAVTYLDLGGREGAKNSALVESAPVVAVLTTAADTVEARVRTGQAFERVSLAATLDGVAVHPMSQILERPELRADLADLLDAEEAVPQHLFRLGFVADGPGEHTPRWPVETVLR